MTSTIEMATMATNAMAIPMPGPYQPFGQSSNDPAAGFAMGLGNALAMAPQPRGYNALVPAVGYYDPQQGDPAYAPAPQQGNALTFGERLGQSESGGNYGSVNSLGYTGKYQFGEARLTDFNRANGTNYSLADLRENPALQEQAFQWHVADIDRAIDRAGLANSGYSRDALRAVAHLGGIGGMIRFAKSGGTYNPSDDYGTSLADYAKKFG